MVVNTSKLSEFEYKEWCKYKKQGGTNLNRCKIGLPGFSVANTFEHELAKFRKGWELMNQGHKVVLEAVECGSGVRRDLVDLSTGEVYEFETDVNRAARHSGNVNVVMVEKIG